MPDTAPSPQLLDTPNRMINYVNRYRLAGILEDFVMEFVTTAPDEVITLPLQTGTTNFTIDWGDGQSNAITTFNDANLSHTYSSVGTYEVRILSGGIFAGIEFNASADAPKLYDIKAWGDLAWSNCFRAFTGCTNLDISATDSPDLSGVTDTSRMFYDCSSLLNLDVSSWDVSNIEDMSRMFYNCSSLSSLDVSSWDVSNVTDMRLMFRFCSSLSSLDVSSWDVSNVTDMGIMFVNCSALTSLDISNWNISNVSDMNLMLSGANAALSTTVYSAALIYWDSLTLQSGVTAHFGDATYSSGAATTARANIISSDGWSITDGGTA